MKNYKKQKRLNKLNKKGINKPTIAKKAFEYGDKVQPKHNDEMVYLNEDFFRPNTKHNSMTINFFLTNGGLGDYINFLPALQWLAEKNPQVVGRIIVTRPFFFIAEFLFKKYERWQVVDREKADKVMKPGEAIVDPMQFKKYISAVGAHLHDLGFMLYCGHDRPYPGYEYLPRIDYKGTWHWPELNPSGDYAVFTPGATAEARAMPPEHFNNLVNYTIDKGITPVFLGKADFAFQGEEGENRGYFAKFDKGYDFSKGVNLLEKTTLLEATQIMAGAKFVLGIDNGLLHFAGTTEAPIIFGHTVAAVHHRRIRRPKGLTIDVAISPKTLPCISCQSNIRYIHGHRFKFCIYGDYKCLDVIFTNDAEQWKRAIDIILKEVWGE